MKNSGQEFQQECEKFLEVSDQFRLGLLETERQHPSTLNLAINTQNNLDAAIEQLNDVDIVALEKLKNHLGKITPLFSIVQQKLTEGHRVFLVGCGATGRLSLCLESWWRRRNPGNKQVRGLIAGGDLALIHSLEKAEDYPDFGRRHLIEANLKPQDLVIGITEGGETSYVIGAVQHAKKFCDTNPFILYCNEDPILEIVAERSRQFICDENIQHISLPIGPMALSGSTRMQASTILQFVMGQVLLGNNNINQDIDRLIERINDKKRKKIQAEFILLESALYQDKNYLTYQTTADLGMTILTDTTERSPTFGLLGLENKFEQTAQSLASISILGAMDAAECFEKILCRKPMALEWPEFNQRAGLKRLLGFDLSENNLSDRKNNVAAHQQVNILRVNKGYEILFLEGKYKKALELTTPFQADSLLDLIDFKIFLNTHSTAVMGRMGRYQSNVMTWVRPNNYKLIDRTIRYSAMLLEEKKISFPYEVMAKKLFEIKSSITENESVVEKLAESLIAENN